MKIAFWRAEYETGFSTVDEQHQHLFDIINRLHEAMSKGHGKDIIKETLDEMLDYTVEHFANEEKLMLHYDYPNYKEHKKIHDSLTQQVREISEKFANGDRFVTIELSHFLTQWLIHHIKGQDQKMIRFFREKNVLEPEMSAV
ncbi:hemerythrin-like metal-binding protein [Halothece sp. PCC 7418]|uniref:bacteriohemerythrin n=1 Tax=Halothece sp. (strain PCC 7418) TaxID=65093 RepID=UPI0002A05EF1|nr:bacteriohemerythrin [Halothece sp. PCC 7418]AFZ44459.1 hemerythrin-like metal-binding protein [Halothece sp. PCC 7418]